MQQYDIGQLIELVAANGYEVRLATSSGVSVINIFHPPTRRESVFGFDTLSKHEVLRCIVERFCTVQQAMAMGELREHAFHDVSSINESPW